MTPEREQYYNDAVEWVAGMYEDSHRDLIEEMLDDGEYENRAGDLPDSTRQLLDSLDDNQCRQLAELLHYHGREWADTTRLETEAEARFLRTGLTDNALTSTCRHCGRQIAKRWDGKWVHNAKGVNRTCKSAAFHDPKPGDEETLNEWHNWPRKKRTVATPPRK